MNEAYDSYDDQTDFRLPLPGETYYHVHGGDLMTGRRVMVVCETIDRAETRARYLTGAKITVCVEV